MTLAPKRLLSVAAITVGFVLLYHLDWPGFWFGGPLKPSILALSAVLLAHLLRVATWPLVIVFGLLTFALDAVDAFASTLVSIEGGLADAQINGYGASLLVLYTSPITLLGPMFVAFIAHGLLVERSDIPSPERRQ